jgi:DNA-binding transcriptional ArsR family regulator
VTAYQSISAWDALGDPTRRAIFERILRRPRAVAEIAEGLPISRPAVSQHLRVLKEARLVSDRAEGTRRIYSVDVAGLVALRTDLDRFWTHALSAFKAAVEKTEKEKEKA